MPKKGCHLPMHLCHICGWLIPYGIANSRHPLFGTVDHVVPLSKGGDKYGHNRQPAHYLCNQIKADRDMDVLVSADAATAILPHILRAPESNTRRGKHALKAVHRLISDGWRLRMKNAG